MITKNFNFLQIFNTWIETLFESHIHLHVLFMIRMTIKVYLSCTEFIHSVEASLILQVTCNCTISWCTTIGVSLITVMNLILLGSIWFALLLTHHKGLEPAPHGHAGKASACWPMPPFSTWGLNAHNTSASRTVPWMLGCGTSWWIKFFHNSSLFRICGRSHAAREFKKY